MRSENPRATWWTLKNKLSKDSFLSNRGPLQGGVLVLTNSNVQHLHLHQTHTQVPSRLHFHFPRQLSRWSSPCHLRQQCRSTSQCSRPPSLNHTHSFCLYAQVLLTECYNATAASIFTSSGRQVSQFLTTPQRNSFKSCKGEKQVGGRSSIMVTPWQSHVMLVPVLVKETDGLKNGDLLANYLFHLLSCTCYISLLWTLAGLNCCGASTIAQTAHTVLIFERLDQRTDTWPEKQMS